MPNKNTDLQISARKEDKCLLNFEKIILSISLNISTIVMDEFASN